VGDATADLLILCGFETFFFQPFRFITAPPSEKMIKQSDERYFFRSTVLF